MRRLLNNCQQSYVLTKRYDLLVTLPIICVFICTHSQVEFVWVRNRTPSATLYMWLTHIPHQKRPWTRFTIIYTIVRTIQQLLRYAHILMSLRFVTVNWSPSLFMYGVGQRFISAGSLAHTKYRISPSEAIERIISWFILPVGEP